MRTDRRFGNVPVIKVTTKTIGNIMCIQGTPVPGTYVWCRKAKEVYGHNFPQHEGSWAIAWCRRHRIDEIQQAVAWLLMQDKVPVIVRAFE